MIDLKSEIKKIIEEYPEYVIIRHRTDIRCECTKRTSGTADYDCPNCEGLGYLFYETFNKCRMFYTTTIVAHMQDYYIGNVLHNSSYGYFYVDKKSQKIRVGDILYKIKVDENGKISNPIIRLESWPVNDVYKMRDENGKLCFLKIHIKSKTV